MAEYIQAFETNVSAREQVADFGQSFIHSAIERPANGVLQLVNKATGSELPQLEIVGAPQRSTAGTMLGSIAGMATSFYAVNKVGSKVLGDFGGTGLRGEMLRMGTMGAFYEGVLMPSDFSSDTFFKDRFTNGLVGGTTFAAMAAAGHGLNKTGRFAVPDARSLVGSITYGAAQGLAGGLVHAEANAIFKEGKALATPAQFLSDGAAYTVFGGTFGALGYAGNKLSAWLGGRTHTVFTNQLDSARVTTDSRGNPVKFEARFSANPGELVDINARAVKMTDGTWSSKTWATEKFEPDAFRYPAPEMTVASATFSPERGLEFTDGSGFVRRIANNSDYQVSNPALEAWQAKYKPRFFGNKVSYESNVKLEHDQAGRLVEFSDGQSRVTVRANDSVAGAEKSIGLVTMESGQTTFSLSQTRPGTWRIHQNGSVYEWRGNLSVAGGADAHIEFESSAGHRFRFGVGDRLDSVVKTLTTESYHVPGANGNPVVRVDADGALTVQPGTDSFRKIESVNGEPFKGSQVHLKSGDVVKVKVDVGDRYPQWVTETLIVDGQPGRLRINGQAVSPGNTYDLLFDSHAGRATVSR